MLNTLKQKRWNKSSAAAAEETLPESALIELTLTLRTLSIIEQAQLPAAVGLALASIPTPTPTTTNRGPAGSNGTTNNGNDFASRFHVEE